MNRSALQRTKVRRSWRWLRSIVIPASYVIVACFFMMGAGIAQSQTAVRNPTITLDPPTGWELQEHAFDGRGNALPEAPANFRRLGEVTAGEAGPLHTLTLRFAETVRLSQVHIKGRDFQIEHGGSCVEGGNYESNSTCTLLVRFTPQGPGNRLGHLLVKGQSASSSGVVGYSFGIGGFGYAPVVSFLPAVINTLPGSYPSNVGLLSGAQNLTVDAGDTLWIADTGNKVIRNFDSSGVFNTLTTTATGPLGIAVDTFGEAYFDEPSANTMHEIYDYGPVVQINGTGTASCPASAPCNLNSEAVGQPGSMSMDPYNHLFFVDSHQGSAMATVQPLPAKLIFLYNPFPYQTNPSSPMAADASDNIYSLWANGSVCEIVQQSLYNAENSNVIFNKVAGGHTCGFSGDGGLAGNAEIGAHVGQIAFDIAGDMYFSDTANQRVRRIDSITGVIRTLAGTGTAGYNGDGFKATGAMLDTPTGVSVDSQGSVYIISAAASGQVIRKVGPGGYVTFGNVSKGKSTLPQPLAITNTGNSVLTLTNVVMGGPNVSDFKIDNTTTTCSLTPGSTLYSGQTCYIGILFTPAAVGKRTATITLLDNTVTATDVVTMSGTGTLPVPNFKITAPANGATFTSGTPVTFSVSVTSTSGPQPTGTVQFKVDGANFGGPATVSGTGTASTSVTGLTTTTHTLSATYSGDANYAAAGPISVSITVKAAATVKFTSPTAGQTVPAAGVPITVTVSSKVSPVPTGNVTFSVDGKQVGAAVKIVSGKASVTTASLATGTHTIRAAYSGDKTHRATSASETVTAN